MINNKEKLQQVFMYLVTVSADMVVDLYYKKELNSYESNVKRTFDVLEWIGDNAPQLMTGSTLGLDEKDVALIGMISMAMVKYLGDYYNYLKYNNIDMSKNESKFYNSVLKIEKYFEPFYNEYTKELKKMEDAMEHSFFDVTKEMRSR